MSAALWTRCGKVSCTLWEWPKKRFPKSRLSSDSFLRQYFFCFSDITTDGDTQRKRQTNVPSFSFYAPHTRKITKNANTGYLCKHSMKIESSSSIWKLHQFKELEQLKCEGENTVIQYLSHLTNSVLTNHPGLKNWFLTSNISLIHKNFGFSKFPCLTNNALDAERFVNSDRHCISIKKP